MANKLTISETRAEIRASEILDAYGANPECWPLLERQAVSQCIAQSASLQQQQQAMAELDKLIALDNEQIELSAMQCERLQNRIVGGALQQNPAKPGWLGDFMLRFQQPVYITVLASIIFAISSIGFYNWQKITGSNMTAQNTVNSAYDDWMLQQLTGQLTNQSVEQVTVDSMPSDFMSLVELEQDS